MFIGVSSNVMNSYPFPVLLESLASSPYTTICTRAAKKKNTKKPETDFEPIKAKRFNAGIVGFICLFVF